MKAVVKRRVVESVEIELPTVQEKMFCLHGFKSSTHIHVDAGICTDISHKDEI
jgi:hypothetical protein